MSVAAYEKLRAKGCVCGVDSDERVYPCPVHPGPNDNRGLRAWFQAGLPLGFPMERVHCGQCELTARWIKAEAEEYARKIIARLGVESSDGLWEMLTDEERGDLKRWAEAEAVLTAPDMLLYPNAPADFPKLFPELHDPDDHMAVFLRKTGICPRCSTPEQERELRAECDRAGYRLKDVTVFEGVR